MNRKPNFIFEPGYLFFFMVFFAYTLGMLFFQEYILFAVGLVLLCILYFRMRYKAEVRRKEVLKYIESLTYHVDNAAQNNIVNFPLPMIVVRQSDNTILWCNQEFHSIVDQENLFGKSVCDLVPGLSLSWLKDGKSVCPGDIHVSGRSFKVYGSVVYSQPGSAPTEIILSLYWIENTELLEVKKALADSLTVTSILLLDNYEEICNGTSESNKSSMLAAIDQRITDFVSTTGGILRRYDRDRYLFIFEERFIETFIESHFSILDSVREVVSENGVVATLSIGVGRGGSSMDEDLRSATLAIDMAISRGGDQVAIKNQNTYDFYGGRTTTIRRRTKVKSRVIASTLRSLIKESSQVLVMGHRIGDLDSVGAAVGIGMLCRSLDIPVHAVTRNETGATQNLIHYVKSNETYTDFFISPDTAMQLADYKTLLVIVDTNRPDYVESVDLLESCNRVAVIDHHRRTADYIENAALSFHEPGASSASEMVVELIQVLFAPTDVQKTEADALLAGITLDTKNFTVKAGVRTFEAAAYLRQAGADTIQVKTIFQETLDVYIEKSEIVRQARIYEEKIAIALCKKPVERISAVQAADDLLNIEGVLASFVVYPLQDCMYISGRSLGVVNVQFILEKLGGGGHFTTAGAQVKDKKIQEVSTLLTEAIDQYFEEQPLQNM